MLHELETIISSNPLSDWMKALAAIVVVFLVLRVAKAIVVSRLHAIASRTTSKVDDGIEAVVRKTNSLSLFVLALYTGANMLILGPSVERVLHDLFVLALLIQVGQWGGTAVSFVLAHWRGGAQAENGTKGTTLAAAGVVLKVLLWSLVLLIALENLGVNVTGLVAGLGIGGIAVALALQNILGDLFSSLSIMLDKPFEIGDFIIVENHLGAVEHVGWKTTRVRSLGGEQIIFSNADLLRSRVHNYKRMAERRVVFTIGVVYDTPTDTVARIPAMLRAAVEHRSGVRFDRGHFKEFADSALLFECVYYVLSPDHNVYMDTQQEINMELLRVFRDEGIDFAFPTQTINVRTEPAEVPETGGKERA
jgi:small-conductance mechanosensitive channel